MLLDYVSQHHVRRLSSADPSFISLARQGGGVYGDKPAALARFKENYAKLSDGVKARCVAEAFERSISASRAEPS